jgi:hypothetical protein
VCDVLLTKEKVNGVFVAITVALTFILMKNPFRDKQKTLPGGLARKILFPGSKEKKKMKCEKK